MNQTDTEQEEENIPDFLRDFRKRCKLQMKKCKKRKEKALESQLCDRICYLCGIDSLMYILGTGTCPSANCSKRGIHGKYTSYKREFAGGKSFLSF